MRRHQLLASMLLYGTEPRALRSQRDVSDCVSQYAGVVDTARRHGHLAGDRLTGVVGYWLFSRGSTTVGLLVMASYAALGFAGLDHYALAPVSAHTLAMTATIVIEVLAASVLLVVIALAALQKASGL